MKTIVSKSPPKTIVSNPASLPSTNSMNPPAATTKVSSLSAAPRSVSTPVKVRPAAEPPPCESTVQIVSAVGPETMSTPSPPSNEIEIGEAAVVSSIEMASSPPPPTITIEVTPLRSTEWVDPSAATRRSVLVDASKWTV